MLLTVAAEGELGRIWGCCGPAAKADIPARVAGRPAAAAREEKGEAELEMQLSRSKHSTLPLNQLVAIAPAGEPSCMLHLPPIPACCCMTAGCCCWAGGTVHTDACCCCWPPAAAKLLPADSTLPPDMLSQLLPDCPSPRAAAGTAAPWVPTCWSAGIGSSAVPGWLGCAGAGTAASADSSGTEASWLAGSCPGLARDGGDPASRGGGGAGTPGGISCWPPKATAPEVPNWSRGDGCSWLVDGIHREPATGCMALAQAAGCGTAAPMAGAGAGVAATATGAAASGRAPRNAA